MSQAERVTNATGEVHVWQAPGRVRLLITIVCAALLLMSAWVLSVYGYLAVLGVGLVLALVARTWWMVLRPRLTAGPSGVRVVSGRTPVDVQWSEIRRCEASPAGLTIVLSGGREVHAKYPQQAVARPGQSGGPAGETTEADATAAFLAQRAAWARKPTGPAPVYVPPAPSEPARAR